jgi:hypothetical protein
MGWGFGLALFALAVVVSAPAGADEKKPKNGGDPFEAYEEAGKPGPQHKVLESLAGSWTYTLKMWMGPGAKPVESKGTSQNKMILGGRYLLQEAKGGMFGKEFLGRGVTGFDKGQGKYVSAWIDNFGTGISRSIGSADKSGKVLTFEREEIDPLTKKAEKGRDVIRILGKDKYVMEMYKILPGGKEFKVMEITSTRKGGRAAK